MGCPAPSPPRRLSAAPGLGVALLALLVAAGPDLSAAASPGASASAAPPSAAKQIALVLGKTKALAGVAPVGWQSPSFDDSDWRLAPGLLVPSAGVRPDTSLPADVTAIDTTAGGALFLRTRFDVESPAAARLLELRATYKDGFVAFVNGVELARRNLPAGLSGARPLITHGADPERVYVELPPGRATLLAKGNVLAVEIRPSGVRSLLDVNAPSGQVDLAVTSGVRIVRGPYLVGPGDREMSVAWETDLPSRGRVFFQGQGEQRERAVQSAEWSKRHVVRLPDLQGGLRYRYRVEVVGASRDDFASSVDASFDTAPTRGTTRFIVYGDMRAPGHAAHAQVVAAIMREQPALVVNTGDLVAVGSEESAWQRYFEITARMGAVVPVAPALGNHEAYRGGSALSWSLFGLKSASRVPGITYGAFDWGGVHFVLLDSTHPDAGQRDWLAADLAAARRQQRRALVAVCHDGPWSHGVHGGSSLMEREFAPTLAAAGVDVLFSGHDHLYERGIGATARGPLTYVVSGGGGAPLYNPSCRPAKPSVRALPPPSSPSPPNAPTGLPADPASLALDPCPSSVAFIAKTHHYIVVEIGQHTMRLCPRLVDNAPVEPCTELPLRSPPPPPR